MTVSGFEVPDTVTLYDSPIFIIDISTISIASDISLDSFRYLERLIFSVSGDVISFFIFVSRYY